MVQLCDIGSNDPGSKYIGSNYIGSNDPGSKYIGSNDIGSNEKRSKTRQKVKRQRSNGKNILCIISGLV